MDLRQEGVEALARRVAGLRPGRVLLGLAGPPAAGKTTLAAALAAALGPRAAVVGMDGFHYAQVALDQLDRAARKGAPDTFDADGYVALLRRLRAGEDVWAPVFDRHLEEPVGSAVHVGPAVEVVITEGNYLLLWDAVRPLLDAVWYVEVDDETRRARLHARHVEHGRTPEQATAWMAATDEPNAALIARTRDRADAVVTVG
jgi:pantothenate kinase